MKKRIIKISSILLFLIASFVFLVSLYIGKTFCVVPFEQLLYTIRFHQGASSSVIKNAVTYIVPRFIIIIILFICIQIIINKLINCTKHNVTINISFFKKKYCKETILSPRKVKVPIYIFAILSMFLSSFFMLGVHTYIIQHFQTTKIYEELYVQPKDVKISFPEKKQNLIYIVVESEESTALSRKNGGGVKESFLPNLEKLALEYTNFSNTDNLGGAMSLFGTMYTASSLVGQTSGTPLKAVFNGNDYYGYENFYSGFYSIGEVLEKNGYNNYFLLGSDSNFAGRKDYFVTHGNYKILDYNYAKEQGWIDEDYSEWWGFEDKKLFKFAKQQLSEISKSKEPFNFTILTADTHFVDGYLDKSCKDNKFDSQYANVFHCNDSMIGEFISWVKKQSFYKNTTIVITGDHLTMQGDFFENYIPKNYERTVYNVFINSKVTSNFKEKKRLFSVMDYYPTTLAALGAKIEGDRLGFGTNLYSSKKTIVEEYGVDYLNQELSKKSEYYNNYIVGKGYYKKMSDLKE